MKKRKVKKYIHVEIRINVKITLLVKLNFTVMKDNFSLNL